MRTEPRDRRVQLRLTESELAAIDAAAEAARTTRTAYIVAAATGASVAPVSVDAEPLRRAMRAWSGIGANINQIARAANTGRLRADDALRADLAAVAAAALDVKAAIAEMMTEARA